MTALKTVIPSLVVSSVRLEVCWQGDDFVGTFHEKIFIQCFMSEDF